MDPGLYNYGASQNPQFGVMGCFFMMRRIKASATVAATDGTIYGDNGSGVQSFSAVKGGWSGGLHTGSHLDSLGAPAGRNLLYLDFHADWRQFNNLTGASTSSADQVVVPQNGTSRPALFW